MTVLATIVIAIATAFIAALTHILAWENRKLRKAGTEPEVAAYLTPGPDGDGAVNFVLANIGQGPALNVKFSLECDEDDFNNHNVLIENSSERSPMTIIPQGEKIPIFFGISYILYGKKNPKSDQILKPFKVNINYEDLRGKRRKSIHKIDITQYSGLPRLIPKTINRELANSLRKIEKHLAVISGQVGPVPNFINSSTIDNPVIQKTLGEDIQEDDEDDTDK